MMRVRIKNKHSGGRSHPVTQDAERRSSWSNFCLPLCKYLLVAQNTLRAMANKEKKRKKAEGQRPARTSKDTILKIWLELD
ncbi:uncharacterized protein [Drosophila bipectinata]|uniref:uncharacterized protein isoform X2 n=1 Tax=Drosophila bipectinata TaxID=42026 RepID=UPI0038B35739